MSTPEVAEPFLVESSQIEIPPPVRDPSPEKVAELTESIQADGLLQPIGPRKGTGRPYALVFGGHRVESFRRLGRTTIEARLLDFDDDQAESATLAEDLSRHAPGPAESIGGLKRWRDSHAWMDPKAAVAYATAPENASIEAVVPEPSGIKPEAEMGDEEWLEHDCKDALGRLAYRVSFREHAIVWRKSVGHLNDLRRKTRAILERERANRPGPFPYRCASLLEVLHPNDWPRCGPCNGTGAAGSVSQCLACHGHGDSVATGRPR